MQEVDLLIYPKWLITCASEHPEILTTMGLAIHQGLIVDIDSSSKISSQYTSENICQMSDHALMPGFVNAHAHSPMVLLRAIADDVSLQSWLNNTIWPAEHGLVSDAFIHDGMLMSMAEMIRSGTTCFNEHYFYPEIAAKTVDEIGMRCQVGLWVGDAVLPWSANVEACIEHGSNVVLHANYSDRVSFSWAPHSPYLLQDEHLHSLANANKELNLPIHIHCHETAQEVNDSLQQFDKRPLQRLKVQGLLTAQTNLVHMVETNDLDLDLIREHGASVTTCPKSNAKLASGTCPTSNILKAKINLAIGTDSAASNNQIDMLEELRFLSLVSKNQACDPTAMPAAQALYAATKGGAKALGLADKIGSLEKGKCADMFAVDLNYLNTFPQHNPISQLVYAANSQQISHVWVHGRALLENYIFTNIQLSELHEIAKKWQHKTSRYFK